MIEQLLSRVVHLLEKDEDKDEEALELHSQSPLVVDDAETVWPPFPWPPWSGDDPEDDEPSKGSNRTQLVRKLAKGVIKFERKLADASLDL